MRPPENSLLVTQHTPRNPSILQVEDEWIFFTYPPGVYSAAAMAEGAVGGGGGEGMGQSGGGNGAGGGVLGARARDDMDASLDILTASGDPDRERAGE